MKFIVILSVAFVTLAAGNSLWTRIEETANAPRPEVERIECKCPITCFLVQMGYFEEEARQWDVDHIIGNFHMLADKSRVRPAVERCLAGRGKRWDGCKAVKLGFVCLNNIDLTHFMDKPMPA